MDCKKCGYHIVATMQIMWSGYPYHPDCIGEAVALKRAEDERINNGLPPDYESFEDEELFEDEYNPYEENDDLEDIVTALDNQPDVSDAILNRIPAEAPDFRPEVNIHDIVTGVSNQIVTERQQTNGSLIAGSKGSKFVSYEDLRGLPVPEATSSFKPIPFFDFVTKLLDGLWDRRMSVHKDEYVISQDGLKLFGLIELVNEYNGVRFAVGLRSSNDKSMKLALAVGYRVMCCSNGMLQGDYLPLSVKHTAKLELDDSLALGIDRIRRKFTGMQTAINERQHRVLTDTDATGIIYKAFTDSKFPVSLFRTVHKEYFVEPSYDEFKPRTLFSIENAFTTSFKKLQPIQQFEQTGRLGKFLAKYN